MIIKTAIKLSIVCVTLLLSACDSFKNDNLSNICNNSPELCDDLYQIGDCRFKRTALIRARYYDKIEPTEFHQRAYLAELNEYQSCLEITLFMEFTRNKYRKEQRLKNYLRTKSLIKQEVKESKGTQDPMLAYYLWTHYKDQQARQVFLAAANKKDVSDPRLLFKLAEMYAKKKPQKTLNLLYRALAMTHSLDQIPPSTFVFMMNIFYQHRQFENAYVWALIAKKEDIEDEYPINLDLILKHGAVNGDNLITDEESLTIQANSYHKKLIKGNFNAEVPSLNQ